MEKAAAGKRTYLLLMKDGTKKRVTVPDSWKVTFGPIHPGSERSTGGQGIALRFYEGSDKSAKQHAVFTDVASFRSQEVELLEEIVETKREVFQRAGDDSGEHVIAEAAVRSWQDPDAPRQKPSAFEPATKGSQLILLNR